MSSTLSMASPAEGQSPPPRRRRAHKKSRLGCRNCKLRRIKCDEQRPLCIKCVQFGVSCNYDPKIPDLQPIQGGTHAVIMETKLVRTPLSTKRPIIDMIGSSLRNDHCGYSKSLGIMKFDYYDMALLDKFQARTVFCMGTTTTAQVFHGQVVRLASSHRFLMHLVEAVTVCHDRYLAGADISEPDPAEIYHLSHGLVLYQDKLSQPIRPMDRDALFVASTLIGIATFAAISATTVEDAWPLAGTDLNWLHLSNGKHAVVELTDPLRKDSPWLPLINVFERALASNPDHELRCSVFDHLCESKGELVSPSVNPYHESVHKLAPLLELDCNDYTWVRLLTFLMNVAPSFKNLLEYKDPWAMLMLAYWYVKVCQGQWWLARRCILEGLAICLYIERFYPGDKRLQEAVIWPKAKLEPIMRLEGLRYS